jgi:hypothetical protein
VLLIRALGALAALSMTACSGCASDTVSDAGGDAAAVDGHYPGTDAGQADDAGAVPDAPSGIDAGVNPFVGSWGSLGAANTCSVRLALEPAKSIPPLTFAPCASGRAGCRKLVVNWWTTPPGLPGRRVLDFRRGTIARVINGTPYLLYSRVYPDPTEVNRDFLAAYISVLQPIDGAPIFAAGSLGFECGAWTTFGDYGIGLVTTPHGLPAQLLAWAPWSTPTTFASKAILTSQWGSNHAQSVAISAGQLYVETVDYFSVDVFDLATQTLLLPSTPTQLSASGPIPVPGGALVLDGNSPYHADILRPDATYASLISPTTPHQLTWAAVDRSLGNALVWVESDFGGAGYVNPVLWTSPYASLSGNVARRKVAVIADALDRGGADMAVNAGVALTVVGETKALLTRLADGMSWSIAPEPGDAFISPVWVDDNELWIATGEAGRVDYGAHTEGIFRLQRSSLGAPTVPRGF